MHVGLDIGERWFYAAQQGAGSTSPRSIPDLRNPRQLATRLCVHIGPEGALVGEIAEVLGPELAPGGVISDFREHLDRDDVLVRDDQGRDWLPEGILALCLQKLRRDVQAVSTEPWNSLTITVPTDASSAYRQRLWSAARLADVPLTALVDSPRAIWEFAKGEAPDRGPALIVQIGETRSSLALLQGHANSSEIVAHVSLPGVGLQPVLETVARRLLAEHEFPAAEIPLLTTTMMGRLRDRDWESRGPSTALQRTDWLIGGRVREFLVCRSLWETAWQPLREQLLESVRDLCGQAKLPLEQVAVAVLAGAGALLPELAQALQTLCPHARCLGAEESATHWAAFGAALITPGHSAALVDEPASTLMTDKLAADIGVLILNPQTRLPDVDVLFAGQCPLPGRATRRYLPQQPGQTQFELELVSRDSGVKNYQSLTKLIVPLDGQGGHAPLELFCTLLPDLTLTLQVSGRQGLGPLERRVSVQPSPISFREQSQRELLQTTSWRD